MHKGVFDIIRRITGDGGFFTGGKIDGEQGAALAVIGAAHKEGLAVGGQSNVAALLARMPFASDFPRSALAFSDDRAGERGGDAHVELAISSPPRLSTTVPIDHARFPGIEIDTVNIEEAPVSQIHRDQQLVGKMR